MTNGELIVAVIVFIVAGICAFISFRQFAEKGVPFNNAYLYASKEERKRMDLKPCFRQSAIVFCFLTVAFIIIGLAIVFQNDKIQLIEIPVIVGAIIYAIASSIRIEKSNKR